MKAICAIFLLTLIINPEVRSQTAAGPGPRTVAFDSTRDASTDIDEAIVEAQKTGKRILLDVGGDWCPYCHTLDQFFLSHPDILEFRDANFILVKVYYGADKKNEQALSRYSKVLGIPHFFVLDSDGTLLRSQHVLELKADGNYSPSKMKEFLAKWSTVTK